MLSRSSSWEAAGVLVVLGARIGSITSVSGTCSYKRLGKMMV